MEDIRGSSSKIDDISSIVELKNNMISQHKDIVEMFNDNFVNLCRKQAENIKRENFIYKKNCYNSIVILSTPEDEIQEIIKP